jgi:hypothetical protein
MFLQNGVWAGETGLGRIWMDLREQLSQDPGAIT